MVSLVGRAGTPEQSVKGKTVEQTVAERFKAADKDHDDRLTKEELGPGLFRQLNSNGDEFVTLEEAQAEIRKRGFDAIQQAASRATMDASAIKVEKANPALRQGPKRLIPGDHGIGRMIPDLALTDISGRTHHLSDFADRTAIVIAFTNTTCPICKKLTPTLSAIEQQFSDQKVQFFFVNPTASDKTSSIEASIRNHKLAGPYIQDPDGLVARALGATRTTDVFVLDARRTLIYRGAVDDQYGFEYSLDAPRTEYLKLALRSLVDKRPLLVSATEAPGCPLEAAENAPPLAPTEVTFHNRISRIVQARCQECHRDGGAAPFALDTYESTVSHAGAIRLAVERKVMPPWYAAAPEHGNPSPWANDKSLSEVEKADLLSWLDRGKPRGNPQDSPLPREFPDGWRIGHPDHIVQLSTPQQIKATGVMPYQNVIVDTGLTEDKWISAMEIRPTAIDVVHHVLVFVLPPASRNGGNDRVGDDEDDGFFAAYAPGNEALVFAEGFGKKVAAGSRLKFQMHYTPNGTATQDQTRIGMKFASREPQYIVQVTGIANPKLSIPPGAENHEVRASRTLPTDVTVFAFFPHMHLRGKSFRYEAVFPDGHTQLLLDVPRYDFNWQLSYRLAEPLELPKGTTLQLTGWFDNSKNNPANPDPSRTVRWGPQTFDEMMLGYIEFYSRDSVGKQSAGLGQNLEALFTQFDRDKNGKLTGEELPANWKDRLLKLDTDNDQAVTLEEIQQGIRRRKQRAD